MHFAEGARGKSEEISADGPGFFENGKALAGTSLRLGFHGRIGDHCPAFRSSHFEMKAPFQIRLVEARKSHLRIHGNKERVEVLGVVVFVFKARDSFSRRSYRSSEIYT